jgi:hypothetical protein
MSGNSVARIDFFPSITDGFGESFDFFAAIKKKRNENSRKRGQNLRQESSRVGIDVGPAFASPCQREDDRYRGGNRERTANVWRAIRAAVIRRSISSKRAPQFACISPAIHDTRNATALSGHLASRRIPSATRFVIP